MTYPSANSNPMIGQFVGSDPGYAVTERARLFQRAQQMGIIPSDLSQPGVSQQSASAAFGAFPLGGQGGPVRLDVRPAPGETVPPAPELPPPPGQSKEDPKPSNKYGLDPELFGMLEYFKDGKETPEEYAKKMAIFEDFALKRGKQQQKFGLQSNLVGWALQGLPQQIANAYQARNRYMDANVQTIRDAKNAASAYTGGLAVGNYRI